jgi:hypothetical protein
VMSLKGGTQPARCVARVQVSRECLEHDAGFASEARSWRYRIVSVSAASRQFSTRTIGKDVAHVCENRIPN